MSTDPLLGEIAGPGSGPPLEGAGVTPPSLSGAGRRFLSDILVELGFVDQTDAENAVEAARSPGQTPEKVLLESGAITEDQLARALAERYGLDHIDLAEFAVDASAAALLRQTAAKRYLAAPVGFADDGALILAVADPADSLGLSDIAVMTKLPVRPAVAARSQIVKLLDTMAFMEEPAQGASQSVSTVIVPPDGDGARDVAETGAPNGTTAEADRVPASGSVDADAANERELARLREELALALVARDEALAKLASHGERAESAAKREHEEAMAALRLEHERVLAASETAAGEALRAERASAQRALAALRAKHDEAVDALKAKHDEQLAAAQAKHDEQLAAERAKRVEEVEAERERTAAAIEAERERNAKELEALRARLTEELKAARQETADARDELASVREELQAARDDASAAREEAEAAPTPEDSARLAELERELAHAREQLELTADADRRAEAARAALAALRDESERQAQVHALTERELRNELEQVRGELDSLKAGLAQTSNE